ncbi:hypothetical protein EMCRGX_G011128 [Ephydatia muelleri]
MRGKETVLKSFYFGRLLLVNDRQQMTLSVRVALVTIVTCLLRGLGGPAVVAASDDDDGATGLPSGNSSASIPTSMLIVVSLSCSLSMLGAGLIIGSYAFIPRIRTKAREILVHISLMDFLTAAFNLFGIVLTKTTYGYRSFPWLCQVQATFSMYGTEASVLWTIGMAVHIYARVIYEDARALRCVTLALYVLCYGIPAVLTLWFSLTHKLGYDPLGGSGWCSLVVQDKDGRFLPFNVVFGNDIWIYLTIILVPVVLLGLHFQLRRQLRSTPSHLSTSVMSIELKLLMVPVVFILLRMWSLILTIIEVEAQHDLSPTAVSFFLHISGFGDSGQGFANSILFCVLTPRVRNYLFKCCVSSRRTTLLVNRSTSSEARNRLSSSSDSKSKGSELPRDGPPVYITETKPLLNIDS